MSKALATRIGALLLLASLLMSGCAHVQPWERGRLQRACMRANPSALRQAADAHMHETREAIAGGEGGGGTSCGCN